MKHLTAYGVDLNKREDTLGSLVRIRWGLRDVESSLDELEEI